MVFLLHTKIVQGEKSKLQFFQMQLSKYPNVNATREPEEPCFKHFKHLSSVISMKLKEHAASRGTTPDNSSQQQQIEQYLRESISLPEDADVLDFWIQHEQTYPDVADVVFDILDYPSLKCSY